jgi:hypothetical protein
VPVPVPADADRSLAAEKLADAYRWAHDARDSALFASLVEWDRVPPATRAAVLRSFEANLGLPIQVVYLTPVDPEASWEYTLDDVTYGPNLEPVRVLHVLFDLPDGSVLGATYLIGRALDASFRIAASVPAS